MSRPDSPTMLSVDAARERVVAICAGRRMPVESVPLHEAQGRVLAVDAVAGHDIPAFANSAMDGFALRGADLPEVGERAFRILATRLAGDASSVQCGVGECVRVTTGASMPGGVDTVIIKERVRVEGGEIIVSAGEQAGSHVRARGDDIAAGEIAVARGERIDFVRLGVLATLGMARIPVHRRPRVRVLTTGDELVMPGDSCTTAQVYNSNGYSLAGMLRHIGIEPVGVHQGESDLPFLHVRDERDLLGVALLKAAADADVLVTSGSVSAGEADFLPGLIAELGQVHFWKVRMRPGMPFLCGEIGRCLVFALPGNPVSTMATFHNLVRPGLEALLGSARVDLCTRHARLAASITKRHERTEFLRGRLDFREDGSLWVRPLAKQGSSMLRGMLDADAFIVMPETSQSIAAGEPVQVIPFNDAY